MREKLIQIVTDYFGAHVTGAETVADRFFSAVRCDGCRYWGRTEATETSDGRRLCMHMNGPVTSKPDSLCAYWEGK